MVTKNLKGFSLIELIIVVGLISLLMLAISSTMLMSIMSSNRIRNSTKIKQAGSYAIGQIQGLIRNASDATCILDSGTDSITTKNVTGGETQITAVSVGSDIRIASNSGVYLTPEKLKVTSFNLDCLPNSTEPSLVKVSFDLQSSQASTRQTENPTLHFETSVSLRNQSNN